MDAVVDQCVGRFCLRLPASMKRAADEASMQGVALEEVAWDKAAKDPWEHEWLARLQKIEALKSKREVPTLAYGEIVEQKLLKPGVLKAVLFCPSASRSRLALGAISNAGHSGLWLQIGTGESKKDEAAARVTELALAYRPDEPGGARPKGAFHLARGAVALPFKLAEEAQAHFRGGPLDLELQVALETAFEPDRTGLMAKFSSALEHSGVTVAGGGARPLRNQGRKVAGMDGEELVLLTSQDGEEGLYFQWRFPGEPKSGKQPELNLVMRGTAEKKDEKIAFWDALLDGLKPAP